MAFLFTNFNQKKTIVILTSFNTIKLGVALWKDYDNNIQQRVVVAVC